MKSVFEFVYLQFLLQIWCVRCGLRMCGGQCLSGQLPCFNPTQEFRKLIFEPKEQETCAFLSFSCTLF